MRKTVSAIAVLTVITLLALSDIPHAETLSDQICSHIGNTITGTKAQAKAARPDPFTANLTVL